MKGALFLKEGKYVRYDWGADRVRGRDGLLSEFGLPVAFRTPDASLCGTGPVYGSKVYFFKGAQYIRVDWPTLSVDQGARPISAGWKLPARYHSGVDAALNGAKFAGRASVTYQVKEGDEWRERTLDPSQIVYFFKGADYVAYDLWSDATLDEGKVEDWLGKNTTIEIHQDALPFDRVDAALLGDGLYDRYAYFFKGKFYYKYEWWHTVEGGAAGDSLVYVGEVEKEWSELPSRFRQTPIKAPVARSFEYRVRPVATAPSQGSSTSNTASFKSAAGLRMKIVSQAESEQGKWQRLWDGWDGKSPPKQDANIEARHVMLREYMDINLDPNVKAALVRNLTALPLRYRKAENWCGMFACYNLRVVLMGLKAAVREDLGWEVGTIANRKPHFLAVYPPNVAVLDGAVRTIRPGDILIITNKGERADGTEYQIAHHTTVVDKSLHTVDGNSTQKGGGHTDPAYAFATRSGRGLTGDKIKKTNPLQMLFCTAPAPECMEAAGPASGRPYFECPFQSRRPFECPKGFGQNDWDAGLEREEGASTSGSP